MKRIANGFTLLEMLVAVAVFAVVATLAYGGLLTISRQKIGIDDTQTRLAEVRLAVSLLERDITQLRARPVREAFQGDLLPAFRGGVSGLTALEFTRGGWRNPAGLPRASLQRVAWAVEGDELVRYRWPVLDQAQDTQPIRTVVLEGLLGLSLRFIDSQGEPQDQWPPISGADSQLADPLTSLPFGVEITLDLEPEGRMRRLIAVRTL